MSLGSIIKNKRKQLNLTLEQIAQSAGCSKPYLSNIENDKVKNPPSDILLGKLEKILKFRTDYLVHIAHLNRLPVEIREEFESAQVENMKLKSFMKNLLESEGEIKNLINTKKIEMEKFSSEKPASLIPVINRVSAGYPTDFDDMDYPTGIADDYIRCPDIGDPNAFGVRVVGDSMEPKFAQGDIVIFSPNVPVNNGDDCFVRFHAPHQTTFKRVYFEDEKMIRLQPRNDKYSPTIVEGDRVNGIYRAVRKIQEL